ncbi:MAG: LytTR family transcriptional regulator DNA-binding domain-containing protein [Chitinophagales bacterium]
MSGGIIWVIHKGKLRRLSIFKYGEKPVKIGKKLSGVSKIHRSYIVALNKIDSYNHELIWVTKQELPISRMYRHEVEAVLK